MRRAVLYDDLHFTNLYTVKAADAATNFASVGIGLHKSAGSPCKKGKARRVFGTARARQEARMVTSTLDSAVGALYSEHVNPQWVRLLDLLEMNVRYERCSGSELFTADGRRILDFLSGYCVHKVRSQPPRRDCCASRRAGAQWPGDGSDAVAERAGAHGKCP
jgi:hypothetical protein